MANVIKFEASTKNCYAVKFLEASTTSALTILESTYNLQGPSGTYGIRKDSSGNHYIVCTMLDEVTISASTTSASGGMFNFTSSNAFFCWGKVIESSVSID